MMLLRVCLNSRTSSFWISTDISIERYKYHCSEDYFTITNTNIEALTISEEWVTVVMVINLVLFEKLQFLSYFL